MSATSADTGTSTARASVMDASGGGASDAHGDPPSSNATLASKATASQLPADVAFGAGLLLLIAAAWLVASRFAIRNRRQDSETR